VPYRTHTAGNYHTAPEHSSYHNNAAHLLIEQKKKATKAAGFFSYCFQKRILIASGYGSGPGQLTTGCEAILHSF
jgi:hypothetical protein